MVDSEHLQIAQIALSVRRAPGGRAVDITSSLVMFIASHVSAEARERASPPGGAEVRFDNASVQAVRVLRRCDGSAVDPGAREHEPRLERGSMRPPSSTAAISYLPANYDGDKRVLVVSCSAPSDLADFRGSY